MQKVRFNFLGKSFKLFDTTDVQYLFHSLVRVIFHRSLTVLLHYSSEQNI